MQPTYGGRSNSRQPQYGNSGRQQPQYNNGGGRQQQPSYGQAASNAQPQYGGGGGDDNIAMLEKAVPGVPGQDYPIYAEVPDTSFSCDGQVDGGYYADPQAECQVFHICTNDGQGGLSRYSFLCPNGTIFNQEYFICDWWFNFDCSEAESLYSLNEEIAAEREAATQALLSAAASNGQPTYLSNSYSAPTSSASGGYNAPSSNRQQRPRKNGGGGNKRKNNNRGQGRNPASSYSAPASQGYGAPSSSNYGAPTSQAASTGYGSPTSAAASSYGAPASNGYNSPDYDSLPTYGKK